MRVGALVFGILAGLMIGGAAGVVKEETQEVLARRRGRRASSAS